MREVINSTYISLDGAIEHPETWPVLGGFGAEGNRIQTELVRNCSAILMGRRTYESFAPVWSTMSGNELADKMNAMPKYVASSTLSGPDWNNSHVLDGGLEDAVKRLKAEPGGDIVQFGFGEVSSTLVSAGLLDRLRLWMHPFFVGSGGAQGLLYRDLPLTMFDLENATPLESGIVILDYHVRKSL